MAMSLRAYARHRRVRLSSVQAAIATGRILTLPDGRIDPARADADWEWNTDTSKPRNSVNGTGGKPEKVAPESFSSARARRERAQAELAELELARQRGDLVPRAQVERDAFEAGRRGRDRTLLIGLRLLPSLLPLVPEAEREVADKLVNDELRACCTDLSDPTAYGKRRSRTGKAAPVAVAP